MLLYAGPGLDGGVIAAVLGILVSFVLAVFAIIWFPLKKGFRKIKSMFKKQGEEIK
jgi:hypothetical protein